MANRITEELIRKKSEHNEGLLGDLEELSLHQCELGRLEVLGTLCRKLRILYLQNNVIPKIENVEHLKDLEYLNLALNNVRKIEGLQNCEFLKKLDLTVNFIDVDTFEASVDHLTRLHALRELFLMGNPCTNWEGHRAYVVARCPHITTIDGKAVTRSERILASQQLEGLSAELKTMARRMRAEKGAEEAGGVSETKGAEGDDDDRCDWTPETRVEIAEEQAEQKRQEEARRKEMAPPERDYEREHLEKVAATKKKEEESGPTRIRQCNEGRYDFRLDDEDGKGNVVLSIPLPKFLDNSLLSVDVHPTWITVVIKGKVLRLELPEEVKPDAGSAQRSRTTGTLVVTMPKENPNLRLAKRLKQRQEEEQKAREAEEEAKRAERRARAPKKMGDLLLAAASSGDSATSKAVDIANIVRRDGNRAPERPAITARKVTQTSAAAASTPTSVPAVVGGDDDDDDWEDDDDVPPLE